MIYSLAVVQDEPIRPVQIEHRSNKFKTASLLPKSRQQAVCTFTSLLLSSRFFYDETLAHPFFYRVSQCRTWRWRYTDMASGKRVCLSFSDIVAHLPFGSDASSSLFAMPNTPRHHLVVGGLPARRKGCVTGSRHAVSLYLPAKSEGRHRHHHRHLVSDASDMVRKPSTIGASFLHDQSQFQAMGCTTTH